MDTNFETDNIKIPAETAQAASAQAADTAAVVGLGLIGSSIARALKSKVGIKHITGIDIDPATIKLALESGVVDKGFTEINESLSEADIVFICTPVKKSMEILDGLGNLLKPGCIVTDVGSTKTEVIQKANRLNKSFYFIGGHPMAGSEQSGFKAGKAHLFENAYYVLIPCDNTPNEAIAHMVNIVMSLGSIPLVLNADEHDLAAGAISHVPHVISAALVNLVKSFETDKLTMQKLAAGGFRDITRISSSSPAMWENITFSNEEQIRLILKRYIQMLTDFLSNLENHNSSEVFRFFNNAKMYRSSFPNRKNGLIAAYHDMVVDVEDRPGIIGEIAATLGDKGINIKNIQIINSRELEQGALRISLPDLDSLEKAYRILEQEGYRVFKVGKDE